MRRYGGFFLFSVCALTAGLLAGCGAEQETEDEKNPYAGITAMEGTPVVDYTVPRQFPNIMAARGYSLGGEMDAAVKGHRLPGQFRLVDAATGEIVYTGEVEDVAYSEELGLYSGQLEFDDFQREGTYYLECDIVGQSLDFEIRQRLYEDLFAETCEELMENCRRRTLPLRDAVALLEAYEWYGSLFPDDDGDEVADVLKELRGWVSHMEENGLETGEEPLYAALLAKFSYLYQKSDHEYATDCLKRASTVFGQIQTAMGRDADTFFALTELYRATGLYTYRNQIADYKSFFENNSSYLEENGYLYAIMTYMSTRQRVDVELCEEFMGNLMNRSEEVSNRYADMIHPVASKNNGSEDILKCAVELSCANYIMNNYQYTRIAEEFFHYLMGQNPESVCFYEEDENRGGYLLLLAQLAVRPET